MSLPIFSFSTTADEASTALASEIKGKNVLVTGASVGGIGFETACAIVHKSSTAWEVNSLGLNTAEDTIKIEVLSASIRPLVVDLSSLAAVRKAAAEANAFPEPLHVSIHSAAAPIGPFTLTADSLESQLATAQVTSFFFPKIFAASIH
ncbi:hypothetical protein K438DRAFT_1955468 [Mycena galopus ATCC 62051]|nr:hypothetical protein K438DRAFT_1955468 [Mycena galopus ATCC 62051]